MHKTEFKQKIRVMRLLSRMNVGGPSRHVVNLAGALQNFGYETRLMVGIPESAEGSMLSWAELQGVIPNIIARLDRPVVPLSDFAAFQQIVREIRTFKPHIVHTHTTKAGILGRLAAVLCGVPAIFHTYHGFIFSGYFSEPVSQLIVGVERFLSGLTDRLITLTPQLAEELDSRLKLNGIRKIETVPLGLDLRKNLAVARKSSGWRSRLGLAQNSFLLGIVARLVPVKNHALLLQAVAEMIKWLPEIHLAVVGGGELESELRQMATSLGIAENIHFCGIVDNIEEVYSDLDLLVLSSKNEGTPVVIIEALASGCPVAATRVGGVSEILAGEVPGQILPVDQDGFIAGLREAILACRSGDSDISHEFRKKWAASYSVDALALRIDAIYRKTLKIRGIDV